MPLLLLMYAHTMPLLESVLPELVSTVSYTGAVNATSAAVLPASSPPLFAWALWLWVSGVLAVSLTLLVLHRVYDAYVGCQKCNARETPAKYPALSEPHIVQPTSITLLHALQFLLVQLNYVVHLFCCLAFWLRVHCWPFAWGQLAKDADFARQEELDSGFTAIYCVPVPVRGSFGCCHKSPTHPNAPAQSCWGSRLEPPCVQGTNVLSFGCTFSPVTLSDLALNVSVGRRTIPVTDRLCVAIRMIRPCIVRWRFFTRHSFLFCNTR